MNPTSILPFLGAPRQFASVRRIVLDDGSERGVRALVFSTGGGLDFWAMTDRALDIGPLSWRGTPLAWQAPHGFRSPALHVAGEDDGYGFDRSFSGLLATAGLDHTRHPADGRPHHGRIAMTPASLHAYGERWDLENPVLVAEGEIVQSRFNREALVLRRRIEAPIGGARLVITDVVENIGPDPCRQAMLYHLNFGFPGIGQDTAIDLDGAPVGPPVTLGPTAAAPGAACSPVPGGGGEAVCRLTVPTQDGATRIIAIAFSAETLPFLQTYRNLRSRSGLLAIEPCSGGLGPDGRGLEEAILAPGETRLYRVEIRVEGSHALARLPQDGEAGVPETP